MRHLEPVPLPDPGDDLGWRADALCAQTDPEAFFPEKGGSTRNAKQVCVSCRVRTQCLDWALANDQRFGVWGGLSERERRQLKATVAAATTPTPPTAHPRSRPGRRPAPDRKSA